MEPLTLSSLTLTLIRTLTLGSPTLNLTLIEGTSWRERTRLGLARKVRFTRGSVHLASCAETWGRVGARSRKGPKMFCGGCRSRCYVHKWSVYGDVASASFPMRCW